MKNLKVMKEQETRGMNGGAKRYFCPWGDYSNGNFWKTYGHAITCGYKHGYFNLPISLIKAGLRLR